MAHCAGQWSGFAPTGTFELVALVFVAAEAREFSGLLRRVEDVERPNWPVQWIRTAMLNGRRVAFVANGPGPRLAGVAAEEALKRLERVEAFVSTGFCGALDEALNVGDIFVASAVNGEPSSTVTEARPPGSGVFRGSLISQDRVACTVDEKRALYQTGAAAVEMEAAAVQRVARDAAVPFYCVRVVSDTASESLALDFNRLRDVDGRFSRSRIIAAALRNPMQTFPQLMRLDRDCKRASDALGDFLAHCRF